MTMEMKRTILHDLRRVSERHKHRSCFQVVHPSQDGVARRDIITYGEAWEAIQWHKGWLSAFLQESLAADATDGGCHSVVVAYLSSNSLSMLMSVLACTADDGAIPALPVMLNTRWTAQEMARALAPSAAAGAAGKGSVTCRTLLLYSSEFHATAQRVSQILNGSKRSGTSSNEHLCKCLHLPSLSASSRPVLTTQSDHESDTKQANKMSRSSLTELRSGDAFASKDAIIVFTSGTTSGQPKGVRLSHRALLVQAYAKCHSPCEYSLDTVLLASTVPFFHIGGLSSALAVLLAGGCLALPVHPTATTAGVGSTNAQQSPASFNPPLVWKCLSKDTNADDTSYCVNTLVVVPAMLVAMAQTYAHQQRPTARYSHVRLVLIGGQSIPHKLYQQYKQKIFPNARFLQTYACTEAASSLTFLDLQRTSAAVSFADCIGTPPPHVQLKIQKTDNRIGLIAFAGPQMMNGYWDRDAPTQLDRNPNEYLTTSDLGFVDGSTFYFCGRSTDTIRTGGETVFASEVERILLRHAEIVECAVFPRIDERFGEAVACVVVIATGADMNLNIIQQLCTQHHLAKYKRPRYLFLVPTIPKTASGKVLKQELIRKYGGRPQLSKL